MVEEKASRPVDEKHNWTGTGSKRSGALAAALLLIGAMGTASLFAAPMIKRSPKSATHDLANRAAKGTQPSPTRKPTTGAQSSEAMASPAAPQMTAADVVAFLDGLVPLQLAKGNIAGAVVVVVKDGKVLAEKGYGYADVKTKRPVSPSATLFRVGSISKLFTWTSALQLEEQGKLNLDRDVNGYLDFKIPPAFGKPITMRDLMTHTPGFEEAVNDLFVPTASEIGPLGAYVKAHLPARIFPPGTTPAYSNYGATLAGYIVQRLSGVPFNDYVKLHIFQPLGMEHSTFKQPLPEALAPLMSKGYKTASQPAGRFEAVSAYPAGSLATTGADVAHFMLAELNGGAFDGGRILDAKTIEMMHARQFGLVPAMNGMCLGFYEESRNGHRIIGHGGDTVYFHSDLHLVPDAGLGFFVSYNSLGIDGAADKARTYLWHQFLDRYFPYSPPAVKPPASSAKDAAAVAGSYRASRGWETSFMKLASVLGEIRVSPGPKGTLRVNALKKLDGKIMKLDEVAPMIWREEDGQTRIAFLKGPSGRWEAAIDYPFVVFFQEPTLADGRTMMVVAVTAGAVLLLALLLWPVAALARRHYSRALELSAGQRRLRPWVKLAVALELAVMLGWVILLSVASRKPGGISDHLWPWLRSLQVLGALGIGAAVVTFFNLYRSWRKGERWWWTRLDNLAIALASAGYLWILFALNLLKVKQF